MILQPLVLLLCILHGPHVGSAQQAECRVWLQGTENSTGELALANAELNCSGTEPVPVAVNPAYISSRLQRQFTGVKLVGIEQCQQPWVAATSRKLDAVLGFCIGSYNISIIGPVVKGISMMSADGSSSVDRAIIVFGDEVQGHVLAGEFAGNNGGSVMLLTKKSQVSVTGSVVTRNVAMLAPGVTAGIWCTQNSSLLVHNSTFTLQNATSNGAGILAKCARIAVSNSSFSNITSVGSGSPAGVGAAVWVMGSTKASITQSSFAYNSAGDAAGAAGAGNQAVLNMTACKVEGNTAVYGGALMAADNAVVSVTGGSLIRNNSALYGGSLFVKEQAIMIINDSVVTESTGQYGGIIYAIASSTTKAFSSILSQGKAEYGGMGTFEDTSNVTIRNSRVVGNMAYYAGGLFAHASSHVWLYNTTLQHNMVKSDGAGVYAGQQARVVLSGCIIKENAAKRGAAIFAQEFASIVLQQGCSVQGNQAKEVGGGAVAVQNASIVLDHSVIAFCQAHEGAGLYSEDSGKISVLNGSTVAHNEAAMGAGIMAHGTSAALLASGSFVEGNIASSIGGGACIADNASITVTQDSHVTANQARDSSGGVYIATSNFDPAALQKAVHGNQAQYSPDMGIVSTTFAIVGPTYLPNFVSHISSEKGLLPVHVNITGPFGLPCDGLLVQATLVAKNSDGHFLGSNRSDSSGMAFMNLKLRLAPGSYVLQYTLLDPITLGGGVAPVNMTVKVRRCQPGEITPGPDTCDDCLAGTYSLNPVNATCDACPGGAECSGGTSIIPQLGMWHSAPESNQIHKCPNPRACEGDRPALKEYPANINSVLDKHNTSHAKAATQHSSGIAVTYKDLQCSTGYEGNLCGQCSPGHGVVKAFTCRTCLSKGTIIALYVVAGVVMPGLIKCVCVATLADNVIKPVSLPVNPVRVLNKNPGAAGPSVTIAAASCASAAASSTSTKTASVQPLRPSELLKAMLLWMQYLLLIYSLGVPWPTAISAPLQAVSWLWSAASPETLSPDCLFTASSKLPPAVEKVLFYLLVPVVMLILLWLWDLVYICCLTPTRRRKAVLSIKARLVVTGFVTLFFFLPSLARTAFGMFACIPIDQPTLSPYVAAAVGRYWIYDTGALCYDGYHRAWSFIVGLPLLVCLCLLVPVSILGVIVYNWKHLHEQQVQQQFGFLYRPYRKACAFWEAVVACQTLVLVAVSVYGVTLGPFYQALLFNCTLALVVLDLALVKPYSHPQAGAVMLQSMGCLFATSYIGLSFLPYDMSLPSNGVYANVIGAAVLITNVVLLVSLLWRLHKLVDVAAFFRQVGVMLYTRFGCLLFAGCVPTKSFADMESVQGPPDQLTRSST